MSAPSDRVAIIGAGQSALFRDLAAAGYRELYAVDISHVALGRLRASLGAAAEAVTFVEADARTIDFERPIDVWHDRATLHFLTNDADRAAYARCASTAVRPGGHVVLAVFAAGAPDHCSGLPVERHSPSSLVGLFGDSFTFVEVFKRVHVTPSGADQPFLHALLQRRSDSRLANES